MFPVEAFQDSVMAFAEILNELCISFHLTGGITSLAYGEPRMTQDIDLVIDPVAGGKRIDQLIRRLDVSRFLFNATAVRTAVADGRQFQLLDSVETLKLDVYPRELIVGELGRSQQFEVFAGTLLPIVSLPDAIVSKLIWISKGSHKSRRDVRQLYRKCDSVQREDIQKSAEAMGLSGLLEQILYEADEIDGGSP